MSSKPTRKEYVMVAINEDDSSAKQVEEEKNEKVDQIGYDELLKRKKEMFDPSIADDDEYEDDDEASFYKQPKKDTRKEVPITR